MEQKEKRVGITINVKASTRKNWTLFFIEHDLDKTQGLEITIQHLIDDVESGRYKLGAGGLSKIQN